MKERIIKKTISLLLVVCFLLGAMPVIPLQVTAVTNEQTEPSITEATLQQEELISDGVISVEDMPLQLDEDCQILKYVNEEVFTSSNHIARLPEEEGLSTYVFLNNDNSKTVYYMSENVKFVAEDGSIQEKDLTLVSKAGGYGVTRSDIDLLLPFDPASGIAMEHGAKSVILIPQETQSRIVRGASDNNSVRYEDYYGPGIDLVYTPMLSGVKEDIVLNSYTGRNSFTFLLQTNGLALYQSEGQYYLANSEDDTDRLHLGEVLAYDVMGKPSLGTMTVTTVAERRLYQLTVSADAAFLTDPNTLYPVTIDPTITVSDNTSGTNAIQDASIYEGLPTLNTGSWPYTHCGYYNSDYGKGRTVYRLSGLISNSTYQSTSVGNILSAKFHVREATGTSGCTMYLYAMQNTSWTESGITWNNAGSYDSSTVYGTATAINNTDTVFDITALVKAWKRNSQNINSGFILVSSNETSVDKSFYSSEYTNADYRPYVVVEYSIASGNLNYSSVELDEGNAIQLTWSGVTAPITWSSSNTSVATVNSSGIVTGLAAGQATIYANATGYTSKSCLVYVTLADGVYYIQNYASPYYLTAANAGINAGTNVILQTLQSSGVAQLAQSWKIKHVGYGYYSIRPMHNPTLRLFLSGSNAVLSNSGGDADVFAPASSQNNLWQITSDGDGYVFECFYMDLTLAPTTRTAGANVVASGFDSSNTKFFWELTRLNTIPDQILLYDTQTGKLATETAKVLYVYPNEVTSLAELNLFPVYSSSVTISQAFTWSSSNTDVTVNSQTGDITGIQPKASAVISFRPLINSALSASVTVNVRSDHTIAYGIPDTSGPHKHVDSANLVKLILMNNSISNVETLTGTTTAQQCLRDLKLNRVFCIHSHGNYESKNGRIDYTSILLSDPGQNSSHEYLYSNNAGYGNYIISTDRFDNLDLAIFVGCHTGAGGVGANNLPSIVVAQGATTAIGFTGEIDCEAAHRWIREFFLTLVEGDTVSSAVNLASSISGCHQAILCGDGSLVVY